MKNRLTTLTYHLMLMISPLYIYRQICGTYVVIVNLRHIWNKNPPSNSVFLFFGQACPFVNSQDVSYTFTSVTVGGNYRVHISHIVS